MWSTNRDEYMFVDCERAIDLDGSMGVADVWSIGELLRNKPRHGLPRNDTPIIQTLDTVILKYRGVTVAGGASVGGAAPVAVRWPGHCSAGSLGVGCLVGRRFL